MKTGGPVHPSSFILPATGGSDMSDVLYELRPDGVALVTMNRPDSLNAMGGELIPLLGRYLAQAAIDLAVRCVVLTGAGRAFCAGGDVKGMVPARWDGGEDGAPPGTPGQARSLGADLDRRVRS